MLQSIGNLVHQVPFLRRVRRNHALEHATIHVLSRRRLTRLSVVGRSTNQGFFVYGKIETDELEAAVREALERLRRGESHLAVHPNCGTNLLTSAVMTTLASFTVLAGARRLSEQFNRLPMVVVFVLGALILAQPLGLNLQRTVTTEPRLGDLEVLSVEQITQTPVMVHWVQTRSS